MPRQYPPELLPPLEMMRFVLGAGNFRTFENIGQRFLEHFRELCNLLPHEHVLEVGSGVGRMAIPLTAYMSAEGRYDGFDIVPDAVRWCTDHITARHPTFRFAMADLYSEFYNPTGSTSAEDFAFPYADEQFDFVFLTSVFTHLLPAGAMNYLRESRRVLKRGGRCFATFFLFDGDTLGLIESGATDVAFPHDHGLYKVQSEEKPEGVVAYREDWVIQSFERAGLTIRTPIHLGTWTGRERELTYQDAVVADRPL